MKVNPAGQLKWLSAIFAIIVILTAVAVLIGWAIHEPLLIQLNPKFAPMQINTALCFILIASAILLMLFSKNTQRVILLLAGVSGLIALLSLIEYLFHINLGIDQIFTEYEIMTETSHAGRMAVNTAIGFLLMSCAIWLYACSKNSLAILVSQILSVIVFFISLTAISSYIFDFPFSNAWGYFSKMALHTSIGFILLTLALSMAIYVSGNYLTRGKKILPPLLLFFSLALVCVIIWNALLSGINMAIRANITGMQDQIEQQLKNTLSFHFGALNRIGKKWEFHEGTPKEEWVTEVNTYMKDFDGYSAIAWVDPDYIIRWILPAEGNEKAVNVDLSKIPTRSVKMDHAKNNQKLTMSGPHELITGNQGFAVFVPIYIAGKFDGFITGAFDLDKLFKILLSKSFRENYRLKISNSEAVFYETYGKDEKLLGDYKVEYSITLLDELWTVTLWPTEKLISSYTTRAPTIALLSGLSLSLIFSLAWYYFLIYQSTVLQGRKMVNSAQAGLLRVSSTGEIEEVNDKLCEMVRVNRKKLLKDGWLAFVEKDDYESVKRNWENSLKNDLDFFADFKMIRGRASSIWVQCYSTVQSDAESGKKHHILTFYNIDFLKRKEKKLKELTYKDDLTDLPNRRYLNEFLNHALFDAQRNRRKFTFLYMDLDYFKKVNDTLGHSAGDELLVVVGKRFKNILRGEDFIARVGGDEFCMILYEASTEQSVRAMIERMQKTLADPIQISGKDFIITVSIGAVIYNGEQISADELIDRADNALYRAKSSGRNNAKFYFD